MCSRLVLALALVLLRPLAPAFTLSLIAPSAESAFDDKGRAESAVDDEFLERLVANPLTSLSVSSVGSRDTNSFCSNCTTTYGRALDERTLSPRAWMSLTWIWPLEGPPGTPFAVLGWDEDEEGELFVDEVEEAETDFAMPEGCTLLGGGF